MNQALSKYAAVQEDDRRSTRILSAMLGPYTRIADAYAEAVCEIVEVIGTKPPASNRDVVVRDLLADVFDALHEGRKIIMTGRCSIAHPVFRRAYESLSLMTLCLLDASVAERWHSGKSVRHSEVRRGLAQHDLGKPRETIGRLDDFFVSTARASRDMIPRRLLGKGNQFLFGAVGQPSLPLVSRYCTVHLRMWSWCVITLLDHNERLIFSLKPDFTSRYLNVAAAAEELHAQLEATCERQLAEKQPRAVKRGRG